MQSRDLKYTNKIAAQVHNDSPVSQNRVNVGRASWCVIHFMLLYPNNKEKSIRSSHVQCSAMFQLILSFYFLIRYSLSLKFFFPGNKSRKVKWKTIKTYQKSTVVYIQV